MSSIEQLRRHDEVHGLRTAPVLEQALEIAPHLGELSIIQGRTQSRFDPNCEQFDWSIVHVDERFLMHKRPFNLANLSERMATFRDLFESRGVAFGFTEAHMVTLGHELGHGEDYHKIIEDNDGDIGAAYNQRYARRTREIATLPPGRPNVYAIPDYDRNTDGFRDEMEAEGLVGDVWLEALRENARAYQKLPSELLADDFAIDVLWSMPKLG